MPVLRDLLRPGLDLVVVGTAAGHASAARRAYYAGRGNRFWPVLHELKLIPKLGPDDYERLLHHGIGLTDLAKHSSGMDGGLPPGCFDSARLRRKIEVVSPSM